MKKHLVTLVSSLALAGALGSAHAGVFDLAGPNAGLSSGYSSQSVMKLDSTEHQAATPAVFDLRGPNRTPDGGNIQKSRDSQESDGINPFRLQGPNAS